LGGTTIGQQYFWATEKFCFYLKQNFGGISQS
jgi:hypothetical protein